MNKLRLLFLFFIIFTVLLIAPFIIPTVILPFDLTDINKYILVSIRLPIVLTAFFVGGILAGGGLAFQGLFRNPLATPYTLGISSGAALGAVFAIVILSKVSEIPGLIQLSAFSGAALSVLIVIAFVFKKKLLTSNSVLLAGVAVNFLFASLIMFFQYLGKEYDIFKITRWLLGTIGNSSIKYSYLLAVVFVIFAVTLYKMSDILDLMSLGDELAITRGVDVKRTKVLLVIIVSFAVAIAISITGPIGFIGIIVPHIIRIITKGTHKILVPFSFIAGGTMLVICDSIGRVILYPAAIPTGVITAMIGAPFFLMLLSRDKGL